MKQSSVNSQVPLIGFVAYSGTGKTTLLTQLIPLLRARGIRLAAIKHSHHSFDIDTPGKDSYRLRKAGVDQMLVASRRRWALMVENTTENDEPNLQALIEQLDQSRIDLILVEGFKHEAFAKIELHRPELGHGLLYPEDHNVIALARNTAVMENTAMRPITLLDINQPETIADFIVRHCGLNTDAGNKTPSSPNNK